MEYAQAKFKQLAIDYVIKTGCQYTDMNKVVADAKIIEAYLKEENDSK